MAMQKTEFLKLMAEIFDADPSIVTENATFDSMGDMTSIVRLGMISTFESHFGGEAIFDELKTIDDMPSLLTAMRSRGFVE